MTHSNSEGARALEPPRVLTFDIFGTALDWRSGLGSSVEAAGFALGPGTFDQIVDMQGQDEAGPYRTYREITALSLGKVLSMPMNRADEIAARVGEWPLFPDSPESLQKLMKLAPCIAMSNSDFVHGEQVQKQLGFRLADWVCAEELKVYKPSPVF